MLLFGNHKGDDYMNEERIGQLQVAVKMINNANQILQSVFDKEKDTFNNLTTELQQTIGGKQMDENIYLLDRSIMILEDVIDDLKDVR